MISPLHRTLGRTTTSGTSACAVCRAVVGGGGGGGGPATSLVAGTGTRSIVTDTARHRRQIVPAPSAAGRCPVGKEWRWFGTRAGGGGIGGQNSGAPTCTTSGNSNHRNDRTRTRTRPRPGATSSADKNDNRRRGSKTGHADNHHNHPNHNHRNHRHHRRRPRPTPRPVTTAEQSRMESLTTGLLCPHTNPPGSLTPPLIRTAHETIFWNLHRKSPGGTAAADALLRRLVTEQRTAGWNATCTVAGRAVEAVLDSWRILSKAKASSSRMPTSTGSRNGDDDGSIMPAAEERAESLLQHLRQASTLDGANDRTLVPSSKSHNMVIDAYARAGRPADARRVYDSHPHPDVVSFNGLIKAHSVAVGRLGGAAGEEESWKKKWADGAERLLRRREEAHDDDARNRGDANSSKGLFGPNAVTYGTVIGALSKLECEEGATRAENTLRRMVDRCQQQQQQRNDHDQDNGIIVPHPNVITFAQVLSAWAKSGSKDAGQRAESLLRWMDELNVRPNAVCYNAAIDAWSRSPDEDAAERAERLLREMEHQRELQRAEDDGRPNSNSRRGDKDNSNPTTITYTSVITAWSRSQRPDAARRAEAVLSDMVYAHERMRDASIRPNKLTYGAVIAAWAASDEVVAGDRAQGILGELIDRYSRGENNDDCRPNAVMFNSTIHALSKNSSTDANDRAREVIANMWRLYDNCGKPDVRPSTTTYNSLLNCLAKSRRDGSAEEALELLRQMETDSAIPSPDIYSYVSVVDALATEASPDASKKARTIVARVEALYRQSSDPDLKPNILLYTGLVRAVESGGELESATIHSIEDHVRREGIRTDEVFCRSVKSALERVETAQA